MDTRDGPLDTRVKDIVQSKSALTEDGGVLTTEPTATVFECIDRMVDRDVGSIVVMDGEAIAGIFTERDYMRNIALKGRSSKETQAQTITTTDAATGDPDEPPPDCLRLMTELRCRHLPVTDEEGELVGIVSIGDGVKRVVKTAEAETARLQQYISGSYPG